MMTKTVTVKSEIGETVITSSIEYMEPPENKDMFSRSAETFGDVLTRIVYQHAGVLAEKLIIEGAKAIEGKKK